MTPLEEMLRRSIDLANNRAPGLTLKQAIAAGTDGQDVFPEDAPLPGHAPTNERALELGWRIIDGGAL